MAKNKKEVGVFGGSRLMFSVADQGPIQGWALTHAMHHAASDTIWDPHNRAQGFWHAHFTWLFSPRTGWTDWKEVAPVLGFFFF